MTGLYSLRTAHIVCSKQLLCTRSAVQLVPWRKSLSPPAQLHNICSSRALAHPHIFKRTMTSTSTASLRPAIVDRVIAALQTRYPKELADSRWDNTGLLLDSVEIPATKAKSQRTVLLTNDLTTRVADEAIEKGADIIISYHPVIFSGLKSITLKDTQQRSLLRLAADGIAVYCPHTAVDASPHGLNNWLADLVTGGQPAASSSVIERLANPPAAFPGAGYGLVGTFAEGKTALVTVLQRLAAGLGGMRHFMVAAPSPAATGRTSDAAADLAEVKIGSFAVCAGSGWDVLKDADAELLVTGEMSHHNALKAVEQGKVVVTVFHSNSERQFLQDRMQPWLEAELNGDNSEGLDKVQVLVSRADEDPFRIVDLNELVQL